jgi:hypothetical protein
MSEISNKAHSELVNGFIIKGFSRRDAVFLTTAIAAAYGTSKLRDEIGSYGMEQLDAALSGLCEVGETGRIA